MKMLLQNGDGTTTELTPDDERYGVMKNNTRTALYSLATLVVKNVLTVLLVIGIILALLFQSVPLAIALGLTAVATIVISRLHIRFRQQVKANAQAWRERYGTWQLPKKN